MDLILRLFGRFEFERRGLVLYFSVLIAGFSILIPNSGLIDKLVLIGLVILTCKFLKRICASETCSNISLIHISSVLAYTLSLDKVTNYPSHDHIYLKIFIYILLLVVQLYIVGKITRNRMWKSSLLSLLLIYTPLVQIPSDLIRQIVGNLIIDTTVPSYFTKIQHSNIYSIPYHDTNTVVYYKLTYSGYEKYSNDLINGGGSMERQYLSQPYVIKLWQKVKRYSETGSKSAG